MSRINSRTKALTTKKADSKPAAAAPAKAPKPAAKPVEKWAPNKSTQKAMERLERSKKAEVTTSEDGTVTRSKSSTRGDTSSTQTLTDSKGKLLETAREYKKTTSAPGRDTESTFTAATDMLGRRSSVATREVTTENKHTLGTNATDHWGINKKSLESNATVTRGNETVTTAKTSSRDSLGNKASSSDVTRVAVDGKTTVTTNEKKARGSELTTKSSTTYEDGKFTLNESADWGRNWSHDKSYLKETEYDASKYVAKADKLAGTVGKVLGWLGLEPKEWKSELPADRMKEVTWKQTDNAFVGARYGVSGSQSASFDGEGISGTFNREAKAGVYAEAHGETSGKYGEASYTANAKAEAKASVDAQGRLDLNGLDAKVNLRAGASVEAEVTGHAQTKSIQFAGTDLYAAVDGRARASAEAVAEATGTVQVTRNPPTAIAKGTVGASAVAKIEGEVRASAGPFSVVASAYASAGAEARATGIIGYENGKLKIGGSAGAALGVGAGAGVTVEVDVKQIGEMAKNAADVNHDGKLDIKDVGAAASKTAHKVAGWFGIHF